MAVIVKRPARQVAPLAEWQGFYSASQVSRLAGVPLRTLYNWAERRIFMPSIEMRDRSGELIGRGYSYADLTFVRMIRALRDTRLDFKSVVIALRHMFDRLGPPNKGWAGEHVYFVGRRIFVYRPDPWGTTVATQYGQKVETRLFGELFEELKELDEGASILIPRQFQSQVQINPKVMGGEPVIKGTRLPTSVVAGFAAKGKNLGELASLYAPVPIEALRAAIEYERFLDGEESSSYSVS